MAQKYKVVFFGTPSFAAEGLKAILEHPEIEVGLVITQPDKPAGRGSKIQSSDVKQLAESKGIPVFQPNRLKKELSESIAHINQFGPFDLGVVIAFGQILPQEILDLPRRGCVNVHASLLPRWRGAAPIQRAIISGDKETGICLMAMDAGLDTGAVYSTVKTDILPEDNFESLHNRLADLGAGLLKKDIIPVIKSEISATPQQEAGLTYAAKITQQEAKINWLMPAKELHNLIRGLSPVPSAYCFLEGKRVKIFKTRVLETTGDKAEPGQVCFTDKSRIEVQCIDGVLSVEELQLEGKKRMPASEFLKGVKISTTTHFN